MLKFLARKKFIMAKVFCLNAKLNSEAVCGESGRGAVIE